MHLVLIFMLQAMPGGCEAPSCRGSSQGLTLGAH